MKAWLISVALLFVLAEFSLWLANYILPVPIYILGGAFLAIASNYERGILAMFRQQINLNPETISQTATLIETNESITSTSSALLQPKNSQQNNK
ncbi:MAG: hypothetical protein ACFCU5_10900 [Pleurocapsa sp.]